MTDVPFHLTRQGARFYEHTLPELVRQLERLNRTLERMTDLHERVSTNPEDRHEEENREEDLHPPHPGTADR